MVSSQTTQISEIRADPCSESCNAAVAGRGGGNRRSSAARRLRQACADFVAAWVAPGGVIYVQSADGSLDGAYEIVSVNSATQLTVS